MPPSCKPHLPEEIAFWDARACSHKTTSQVFSLCKQAWVLQLPRMGLITPSGSQKVLRQEVPQDVRSFLIGRKWELCSQHGFCLYKFLTHLATCFGNTGYRSLKYSWTRSIFLIKACFNFGSKIVVAGLFLPSGINSGCARDNPQIITSLS